MNPFEEAVHLRDAPPVFLAHGARAGRRCAGDDVRTATATLSAAGLPNLPHFAPKAKRAVYMHMLGGPPQQDLFDYKPGLKDWYDKDLPDSVRQGQRLTTMSSGQAQVSDRAVDLHVLAARPERSMGIGAAAAYREDGRRHRDREVALHRADQSRACDHVHSDRVDDRRQAVHRIVAGVWPRQHVRGSSRRSSS